MSSINKNTLPIILGVVVALLLGLNAYLLVNKMQQGKELASTNEKLSESEQLRAELEETYNQTLEELDGIKTENDELYAMVEEQKEELAKAKDKIDRMISRGSSSKKELEEARRQIEDFKVQTQQYLAEIESLKAKNKELEGQTVALTEEKVALESEVEAKTLEAESLTIAKETLEEEKEKLSAKVEIGSVLKTSNIAVQALRTKDNGVEKEVKAAKKADMLRICVDLQENLVTQPGPNQVHVRIVNPRGETLAIESYGSGTFEKPDSGESVRYTTSKNFNYVNSAQNLCVDWTQGDTPFEKGNYVAEVYNRGYLSGTKEFNLK